jgi:hypothetical protein
LNVVVVEKDLGIDWKFEGRIEVRILLIGDNLEVRAARTSSRGADMACGDRRNGEIRAHVMSEKEYHSEPEWLSRNWKGSSMTYS